VKFALALGEHDPNYVDAYYGPAQWREQAQNEKTSLTVLAREADSLEVGGGAAGQVSVFGHPRVRFH
jgi:hypothetical protein